jgi:hypothetical protein
MHRLQSDRVNFVITGSDGFTGAWFCQHLAKKGILTRGMYGAPDEAPDSHPNLELVPGNSLNRESFHVEDPGSSLLPVRGSRRSLAAAPCLLYLSAVRSGGRLRTPPEAVPGLTTLHPRRAVSCKLMRRLDVTKARQRLG